MEAGRPNPPGEEGAPEEERTPRTPEDVLEVANIKPPSLAVRERGVATRLVGEETVRAGLAVLLLILVAFVVIFALTRATTWVETKELLDIVLPALTGLLGSAVGFYFGTRS